MDSGVPQRVSECHQRRIWGLSTYSLDFNSFFKCHEVHYQNLGSSKSFNYSLECLQKLETGEFLIMILSKVVSFVIPTALG